VGGERQPRTHRAVLPGTLGEFSGWLLQLLILQTAGLLPPPCSCVSCVTCAHTVSTLQAFPSFAWARLVLGSSLNITSMPLCLPASFLGSLELELWLCLGILCVHYLTGLISGPPTCGLLEGGKKTSWRFWANLAV
jgi:hypothetical protein